MNLLDLEGVERMGKPLWTVDGVLPSRAVSMLYGKSGTGKSFYALDMACCISTGRKWAGHAVKQGPVVYVAGEGANGYWDRLNAWIRKHQGERPAGFRLVTEPVRLWSRSGETPDTLAQFACEVNSLAVRPVLVVFDTLGTCLGGADENDNGHMNQLADNAEMLAREWGAAVLLVHHVGKAGTALPRGAQALQDRMAMHAAYMGDGRTSGTLTCTKQKDGEPFQAINRTLHRVALGDGRHCLSFADDFATGTRQQTHRVSQRDVLTVLARAVVPMTPVQVAEALGSDRKAVGMHLGRLYKDGKAQRVDDGYILAAAPMAA
jgi:adenosyl cobinamide kinase/adenosyl cobinamide phosphate guanylyltransferase